MADLIITPANVQPYGTITHGVAGGTLTAGLAVRKDTSNRIVAASDTSAVNAQVVGIALNAASADQPVSYQTSGLIDLGATIAVGKVYVASTSGGIAPVDDIAGTEFITVLGVGTAADRLRMGIIISGVAAAGAVS